MSYKELRKIRLLEIKKVKNGLTQSKFVLFF